MEEAYRRELAGAVRSGGSSGTSAKGSSKSQSSSKSNGYNNGTRTTEQIKQMQKALKVEADGYWGPATQAAAGGLGADEMWAMMSEESGGTYKPSQDVQRQIGSLELMRGQTGSETAIANSIVALGETGRISMDDAEYMLRYFGYDPRDYIDYD